MLKFRGQDLRNYSKMEQFNNTPMLLASLMVISICLIVPTHSTTALSKERIGIYSSNTASLSVSLLQEMSSTGNPDARAELSLAKALGAGIQQDLESAVALSFSLIGEGSPTAHTTLGLLLSHNLTGTGLEDKQRREQSLSHYMVAALKGDPLAQVIVGEHYSDKHDCDSALSYYRRGASVALSVVPEGTISRPGLVNYLWEEDNPFEGMGLPSLDELQYFEHLARHGDGEAALRVAYISYNPFPGMQKNLEKTRIHLKMAAKANVTAAMVWLANLFLSGEIEGKENHSLQLLQDALEMGDASAYAGLAKMYMEGLANLTQNYTKAEMYLKKGIEKGSVGAFHQIGILYEELKKSSEEIQQVWLHSAMTGHVHSAWRLAEHFRKRHQQVVSKSITKQGDSDHFCKISLPFYRLVALNGEWYNLFSSAFEDFEEGRHSAALLKYLLLSDLGYPAAHVNAARIIETFPIEVYKDGSSCKVALEMWRRTAKDGVATGYLKMGDYYYYGGKGVEQNMEKAMLNYRKAAILNNPEGLFNEAWMYEFGIGTTPNLELAEKKYTILLEKHKDALVPATMALSKIRLLRLISTNLGYDLHSLKFEDISFKASDILKSMNTLLNNGNLDLLAMLILLLIIVACYRLRR